MANRNNSSVRGSDFRAKLNSYVRSDREDIAYDRAMDAGEIDTAVIEDTFSDSRKPSTQERTPSKLWLNIGVELPNWIDETTGKPVVVTIPLGIAIDNIEPRQVSGDSEVARRIACGNNLLEQIKGVFAKMADGQRKVLHKLKVEAYKVPEQKASSASQLAADELMRDINLDE